MESTFSPDGSMLATVIQSRRKIWNWRTGELVFSIQIPWSGCLAFSADNKLVAWQESHTIVIRDVATGKQLNVFQSHQHHIGAMAFSPDGNSLLTASTPMIIQRWDLRTGEAVFSGNGHDGYVVSLAFSPNGRMLASGANDRAIRLWDCGTMKQLHAWEGSEGVVNMAMAFSADGKMVAAGGGGGPIRVGR